MGTAWGEVRYTWGSAPTDYTYTGQYSNIPEFGLMYYNARWYDPGLGRFAQADTIIPLQTQGVQAWDRYAGMNNNPVRYSDPSGHWIETAFDIISLGMSRNDVRTQGLNFWTGLAVVTDVASVVLPAVPAGASHVIRAAKWSAKAANVADAISDTAKVSTATDNLADVAGAINKSEDVILFGKPQEYFLPQTRPGRDGKVSCSSCSPTDGIWNSFGREPTPDDMYWQVDVTQVKANGGHVSYDGGSPVTDISGNLLGGNYPPGHVSISFDGKSKGWVERNLLNWLSQGKKVIPD